MDGCRSHPSEVQQSRYSRSDGALARCSRSRTRLPQGCSPFQTLAWNYTHRMWRTVEAQPAAAVADRPLAPMSPPATAGSSTTATAAMVQQ